MVTSVIINTCAGRVSNNTKSFGGQPYVWRAYALQNFILPAYIADPGIDEIIVVGEWYPGEGYTYVEAPSIHFSSDDALHQRQAGFEAATGDVLIFQHDDHILDPTFTDVLEACAVYVVVPQRWTRLRNAEGERLPNGEPHYISGHCAIYRREVLKFCPWSAVPVCRTWDIEHTKQIRAANFSVHWSDTLRVWDCEFGASPWT